MTQDFKDKILDYITNNVNITGGLNEPQFGTPKQLTNNVFQDIGTLLTNENPSIYRVLGNIYDNNTQNILYYGFYTDNSSNSFGFIYIVDGNLKKVSFITTFKSGTKLFPIMSMNQDENGYMYALSVSLATPNISRILLFNNILTPLNNEYMAILRQSYIIPNSSNYNFQVYEKSKIVKVPGDSIYYIPTRIGSNNYTTIIEFVLNVESSNEWNLYNLDDLYSVSRCDAMAEKIDNDIYYYLFGLSAISPTGKYVKWQLKNGVLTKQQVIDLGYQISFSVSQVLVKNINEIYISTYFTSSTTSVIEKVVDNNIQEIYSFIPLTATIPRITMSLVGNTFTLGLNWVDSNNDNQLRIGILDNDIAYFTDDYEANINQNGSWGYVLTTTTSNFNLVRAYIPNSTGTKRFSLDYNPQNYNGTSYSSYGNTVPYKGRLYSNGDLIFARNLYNLTLNNSTTTSIVQVPNTFLNNTTITQENLIGKTNSILVENYKDINKNFYETLYINFINTLNVIDEDTNTKYQSTANYINQNINVGTQENCELSFIGKVQIVYGSKIVTQNLIWSYDTDHYETSFTIDATGEVPYLLFMSNDLSTTYLEKQLDIETGNYYIINQKLRIE